MPLDMEIMMGYATVNDKGYQVGMLRKKKRPLKYDGREESWDYDLDAERRGIECEAEIERLVIFSKSGMSCAMSG